MHLIMGIVLKPILLNADQKKVILLKHKIKYLALERNRHFVESFETGSGAEINPIEGVLQKHYVYIIGA